MKAVSISDDLHRIIKQRSVMNGVTIGEMSNELLSYALENYEPAPLVVELKIMKPPFPKKGILEKLQKEFEGEIKPRHHQRRNTILSDKWICPEGSRKPYSSTFELNSKYEVIQVRHAPGKPVDGTRRKHNRSIVDILLVKHFISDGNLTVKEFKELVKLFGYKYATRDFSRFVYNVIIGTFDDVFNELKRRVLDAVVEVGRDNNIYVNGDYSSVSSIISDLRQLLSNCDDKFMCLWNLHHTYPSISFFDILVVAVRINNLRFNKSENTFVENNPSKRRNMIRCNNGVSMIGGEMILSQNQVMVV